MCIYCNCAESETARQRADTFLAEFERASIAMKHAETALLEVSRVLQEHGSPWGRQYDEIHKLCVRTRRMWNSIEQVRERDPAKETPHAQLDH